MTDFPRSISCPKAWGSAIQAWLGPRSYILSGHHAKAATSPWTAIVMSHRNRNPEHSAHWRAAIEKSLESCRAATSFLLACTDTPHGPFLVQAARRFRIPLVQILLPRPRESLSDWNERIRVAWDSTASIDDSNVQLWISPIDSSTMDLDPVVDWNDRSPLVAKDFQNLPLVDRALIAIADKVRVISVASGSKTERILHSRLDDPRFPTASVFVAMDLSRERAGNQTRTSRRAKEHGTLSDPSSVDRLLDCGAVGWFYDSSIQSSSLVTTSTSSKGVPSLQASTDTNRLLTLVPSFSPTMKQHRDWFEAWPYLSHCTRARKGAWPDQSSVGYYDSLIATDRDLDLDSNPLFTLKRILLQLRLVASKQLNRSGQPTVSFTEVPLHKLLPTRHFQSHLARWDWEPYGLCIHRKWIEKHGGRPVIYSNSKKWTELPLQDRPFYQPTRDNDDSARTEWEFEQEWRVVGDIHLGEIPFASAFVFVPTSQEASELAPISRFPIMVVQQRSSQDSTPPSSL